MDGDYIHGIYAITGSTLGEIHKNFNLYVKATLDTVDRDRVSGIVAAFNPTDPLQKGFKSSLIRQHQLGSEVTKMLFSQDMTLIGAALRCPWYFKTAPDNLVVEVLPNLSYTTRLKVIQMYARNLADPQKAEEIFEGLKSRYGLSTAVIILPACRDKFILSTISSISIQLQPKLLLSLYRSHPGVVTEYLEFLLQHYKIQGRHFNGKNLGEFEPIFVKIASKDPKKFMEMYLAYHEGIPYMRLGRRVVSRLLKLNSTAIIDHFTTFKRMFTMKSFAPLLKTQQIAALQKSLFPKTLTSFLKSTERDDYFLVVKHLKPDVKVKLLSANFESVLGKPLRVEDLGTTIPARFLDYMTVEQKLMWVRLRVTEEDNVARKAEFLARLPVSESIPALKKLLENQSDANYRMTIAQWMLDTVQINKDPPSFHSVTSYFVSRLRNEKSHEKIWHKLNAMKDFLVDLLPTDWEPVTELHNLAILNNEERHYRTHIEAVLSKQIQCFFKKGLPINDLLQNIWNMEQRSGRFFYYHIFAKIECERQCLEWHLNVFNHQVWKKSEDEYEAATWLFLAVVDYNSRNKDHRIEAEWLNEKIMEILNKTGTKYQSRIFSALEADKDLKYRFVDRMFPSYCTIKVVHHYLRKNPAFVLQHIDEVLKILLRKTIGFRSFAAKIKFYAFIGLPKNIIERCYKVLDDGGETYNMKPNAVTILSILLPAEKYLDIVKKYEPDSPKVEDFSAEAQARFQVQKAIAASLTYLDAPIVILKQMRNYAVGDYLKLIVGSMTSVCLKVPEKKILPMLVEWLDSPVSVRKHFIRAISKVSPIPDRTVLFTEMFHREKNSSIRLILFNHVVQIFTAEPNEDTFSLFQTVVGLLNSSDTELIDELWQKKIPDNFIGSHLTSLWSLVSRLGLNEKFKDGVIEQAVKNDRLSRLPDQLFESLLLYVLGSTRTVPNDDIFIAKFLLYCSDRDTQLRRLTYFFTQVGDHIRNWYEFNLHSKLVFQKRSLLTRIIFLTCKHSLNKDVPCPSILLEHLRTHLLTCLQPEDCFQEVLLLNFALFRSLHHEVSVTKTADFIAASLDEYSIYGYPILEAHKRAYNDFRLSRANQLILAQDLSTRSELSQLLAIDLLDHVQSESEIPAFSAVITSLLSSSYKSVKIKANSFFNRLQSIEVIS